MRRERGTGSLYQIGRIWWFSYFYGGKRHTESSGSARRTVAQRLLQKRIGAKDHGLPVIANVEKTTFEDAVQLVVNDFKNRNRKSLDDVERKIRLHLTPAFGGRRLVGITPEEIQQYTTRRRADTIVVRKARTVRADEGTEQVIPEVRQPVSVAEVNRELQILKRIFRLAHKFGKLASVPWIQMLTENNARQGFFEPEQYQSMLRHLPAELQPVVQFAHITGWRIPSEVLKLEWSRVDFTDGCVRLERGTTKSGEPRVFYFTAELRAMLEQQKQAHDALKKAGHITPLVFWRMVAEGRGGDKKPRAIISITKAWKVACRAAGCPGRIPHDLRRTAVRNNVRSGIPERVCMDMTGHKTRSVFDRYNIISDGDLREAARKLDRSPTLREKQA